MDETRKKRGGTEKEKWRTKRRKKRNRNDEGKETLMRKGAVERKTLIVVKTSKMKQKEGRRKKMFVEKRGYKKAINYTTRAKRKNEELKKEYKFISKEEFEDLWANNKLLERLEFNNNYYGISIESLREDVVCIAITEVIGDIKNKAKELKNDIDIKVFYISVPEDIRIKRMQKRGDSREEVERRLKIDREKFRDAKRIADYIMDNEDSYKTVDKIVEIAEKSK